MLYGLSSVTVFFYALANVRVLDGLGLYVCDLEPL